MTLGWHRRERRSRHFGRDTPLHRLGVDAHLLGKDGLLREMEGSAEYLTRRKARIDQEVAGKAKGGEIAFD